MKRLKYTRVMLTGLSSILLLACGGTEQGPQTLGKGDMIGDESAGTVCTFDWQCKRDLGHVCRPAQAGDAARCGLPHDIGGSCVEDSDCHSDNCGKGRCAIPGSSDGTPAAGLRCGTDQGWCWATVPGRPGNRCLCSVRGTLFPGVLF